MLELNSETYAKNTEPMLSHVNVGTGVNCTIAELAQMMKEVIGFKGEIIFDVTKPDGAARKLMDVSRLRCLGWKSQVTLIRGLGDTYDWYLKNITNSNMRA